MPIRNLGAIIIDSLRYDFIKKSLLESGNRKYLLDLGCGVKPFRHLYNKVADKSIGIDVATSPHDPGAVDIVYDGKKIPFADNTFDLVLSTEVMEHVADPGDFLTEIHRVLQPSGMVILTTPFMVSLHEEPFDFYRYTEHGIRHLLSKHGFESIKIIPFGDIFSVIIGMNIQVILKFWSVIANGTRMKFLYSPFNPFIFIFAVIPQWIYLSYLRLPLPRSIKQYFAVAPRGYGFTAVKKSIAGNQ